MANFIDPDRIAAAVPRLWDSVDPLFVDFLILKHHGVNDAGDTPVQTTSTQASCDLVLRIQRSDGSLAVEGRPYFNPFRRKEQWLREGYPRFGTYSSLDGPRLPRIVDFPRGPSPRQARFKSNYVALVADLLRVRTTSPVQVPLQEIAIWCGRSHDFTSPDIAAVVAWFESEFRITAQERASLFMDLGGAAAPATFVSTYDPDTLADRLVAAYPYNARGPLAGAAAAPPPAPPPVTVSSTLYERIAEGMVIDELTVKQLVTLIRLGRNVILTGPPGTGKTTLAANLAAVAAGDAGANGLPACSGVLPTTATADWSTFDTIGGYVPAASGTGLVFREGLFLQAIRDNRWLIVDELNRCDADKAFGQLFTVLSGQSVELPFQDPTGKKNLRIVREAGTPASRYDPAEAAYVIGADWRVITTMNTVDRNHLFQLSAAFTRRFATVNVPVPSVAQLGNWFETRGLPAWLVPRVRALASLLEAARPLGPAILRDIVEYLAERADMLPDLRDQLEADATTTTSGSGAATAEAEEDAEETEEAGKGGSTAATAAAATPQQEDPFLEATVAFVLPQMDGLDPSEYRRIRTGLEGFVRPASREVLRRHFSELFRV